MTRLLVALVLLLCASCTNGTRPTPTPPGPAPAGTLRVGYPTEPPTLNPIAPGGGSSATRDILRPVLPALFRLDERLRPVPDLVAAWPKAADITSDPFAVTLLLRSAKWSDGARISSTDVRFSWERLRSGPTRARYRFLKDVEVLSPRRVRLVFDRPVRRWWALFSIDDMVLPAHAFGDGGAWDRTTPVSGGPFVFEGWNEGLSIRLRRNERYWGTQAGLEAMDIVFVPDDETRLQLMTRGDLDLVVSEGDASMGARAAARGWKLVDGALDASPGTSGAWAPMWWELDFDTGRMKGRAALAEAIGRLLDRRLVVEMLEDTGQAMDGIPARFPAVGPQKDGLPALTGPWAGIGGDVAGAQAVLTRAGWKKSGGNLVDGKGANVPLLLAHSDASATIQAIARMIYFAMKQTGLQIELAGVDPARLEADWLPNRRADAFIVLRRGADAPDASSYRSDSPNERLPARGPQADTLIDEAETGRTSGGTGPAGLATAPWTHAQEQIAASRAIYPLARVRVWLISRGGVTGPRATGASSGPFWNAADWRLTQVS